MKRLPQLPTALWSLSLGRTFQHTLQAHSGLAPTCHANSVQVVFPFGGQFYEVQLPPAPYSNPNSTKALYVVRDEANTVLQCLTCEWVCAQQVSRKPGCLLLPTHASQCDTH